MLEVAMQASEKRGEKRGLARGLRQNIPDLCAVLEIEIDADRRLELSRLGVHELDALRAHLRDHRAWRSD